VLISIIIVAQDPESACFSVLPEWVGSWTRIPFSQPVCCTLFSHSYHAAVASYKIRAVTASPDKQQQLSWPRLRFSTHLNADF
jgi:hypothetical protein